MNYVDWYRQQQQNLLAQNQMKGVGGVGQGAPSGFQAPRFGQIESEMGDYTVNVGKAAAEGYAKGGQVGAIIQGGMEAIPYFARAGRRAWDAAKAGDTEGVARSLAPVSPVFYLFAKTGGKTASEMMGMPSWTNPMNLAVKGVAELFGGPRTNIEKKRWERLKMYGFDVPKPEWVDNKDIAKFGENKNLAKDFVGYDESGKWVNNQFANTGKEEALRPQDIYQFATNHETFGEAYGNLPDQEKFRLMQIALDNKLVKEHLGTVDIAWTPETLSQATDILATNEAKMPGANRKVYVPDFGASFKPNF
jgi:hypothetical protein